MTRIQQSLYFAVFAAIAWGLASIPWTRSLGSEFVLGAAICATFAGAGVGFLVPRKWFQRRKFFGLFVSAAASVGVTFASMIIAGLAISVTTSFQGSLLDFGAQLAFNLGMVTLTLFIYPPSLIFWLAATAGLWWLHGRALDRAALPGPSTI